MSLNVHSLVPIVKKSKIEVLKEIIKLINYYNLDICFF
jgi:hypothetical protein